MAGKSSGTPARGAAGSRVAPAPGAAPGAASAPAALPLSSRPHDALIAFWFVVFAFTTTFTDIHNFTASVLGVKVDALEGMTLRYPPRVLTDVYFRWARSVDPLLYDNPPFWQAIEWVNMLVLTPFALLAVVAVLRGSAWVRMPAVVVSAFTHYSLILCMGVTLYGDKPSADPAMFIGVYQLYLVFPLLVIARFWRDAPFAARLPRAVAAAFWVAGPLTFAVFFSYVAKWLAVHAGDLLPSAAFAALQGAKALP